MKNIKARFIIEDYQHYLNDVQDIVRAFSPYLILDNSACDFLRLKHFYADGVFTAQIDGTFIPQNQRQIDIDAVGDIEYKKITKHFLKTFIYDCLSAFFGIKLPYGSLTGVRPTKLYYELLDTQTDPKSILINDYRVSPQKAELIEECVFSQRGIYKQDTANCDIFVNVPVCPTRCNYCSFISAEYGKVKKLIPEYIEKVKTEIEMIKKYISEKGLNLRSVYVGGGTPTSIGAESLSSLLSPLARCGVEFTVEAGRPDTVNDEILSVMKDNNVTRISINPQTFNERTLKTIGRAHSVKDIYDSYEKALKYGFDINMDLIAGLEGESLLDFVYSMEKVVELSPQNVTAHTLSIKRGAAIRERQKDMGGNAREMIDFAHEYLKKHKYKPYYMYRQKNMADNLENTGFCLEGKACVYNIDMMEDISSVFGAGANAMTKIYKGQKIERKAHPNHIHDYLKRDIDSLTFNFF